MPATTFVGTGLIGAALAEAACARGLPVTVWNRTLSRAEPLAHHGATVAPALREAVEGAAFVHIALTADRAVDAVLDQITGSLPTQAIVVDHSTTSAEGTADRADRMREAGIAYLHAPVFMSPAACRAAKGVMVVSGPRSVYARAEEHLRPMSGQILFVGERGDEAAATKLVGNAMILAMVGGFADVLALADAQGLSPAAVLTLFEHFDVRAVIAGRGARMAEGDFETSWSLAMARKDLGLMLTATDGRELAVLPALAARMDALIEAGEAECDLGVLARSPTGPKP